MPTWTTPPTFSDGAVLSAAQLNILSNDLAYLQGVAAAPNVPAMLGGQTYTSNPTLYIIRHRHNTVRFWYDGGRVGLTSNPDVDYFTLTYQGVGEKTINGLAGENSTTVDLTSLGLTVGDLYTVSVEWAFKPDAGSTCKFYWYEAES